MSLFIGSEIKRVAATLLPLVGDPFKAASETAALKHSYISTSPLIHAPMHLIDKTLIYEKPHLLGIFCDFCNSLHVPSISKDELKQATNLSTGR